MRATWTYLLGMTSRMRTATCAAVAVVAVMVLLFTGPWTADGPLASGASGAGVLDAVHAGVRAEAGVTGGNPFRIGRPLVIPHGGGDGEYPENTCWRGSGAWLKAATWSTSTCR